MDKKTVRVSQIQIAAWITVVAMLLATAYLRDFRVGIEIAISFAIGFVITFAVVTFRRSRRRT